MTLRPSTEIRKIKITPRLSVMQLGDAVVPIFNSVMLSCAMHSSLEMYFFDAKYMYDSSARTIGRTKTIMFNGTPAEKECATAHCAILEFAQADTKREFMICGKGSTLVYLSESEWITTALRDFFRSGPSSSKEAPIDKKNAGAKVPESTLLYLVETLTEDLRVARAELDTKHGQWQSACKLGADERTRRQAMQVELQETAAQRDRLKSLLERVVYGDAYTADEVNEALAQPPSDKAPAPEPDTCDHQRIGGDGRNIVCRDCGVAMRFDRWSEPDARNYAGPVYVASDTAHKPAEAEPPSDKAPAPEPASDPLPASWTQNPLSRHFNGPGRAFAGLNADHTIDADSAPVSVIRALLRVLDEPAEPAEAEPDAAVERVIARAAGLQQAMDPSVEVEARADLVQPTRREPAEAEPSAPDDESTLDRVIRFLADAPDMTRGEIDAMRLDLIGYRNTHAPRTPEPAEPSAPVRHDCDRPGWGFARDCRQCTEGAPRTLEPAQPALQENQAARGRMFELLLALRGGVPAEYVPRIDEIIATGRVTADSTEAERSTSDSATIEAVEAPTTEPDERVNWSWGWLAKDGEWGRQDGLGDWCLVEMRDGEPYRSYHPALGVHDAYRDSFRRWSKQALPPSMQDAPDGEGNES